MSDKPFWRLPPFVGLLADPFVQGTELEGGHVAYALQLLHKLFVVVHEDAVKASSVEAAPEDVPPIALSMWDAQHLERLRLVTGHVQACAELAAACGRVADSASLAELVSEWVERVEKLEVGQMLLVPGGWLGMTSSGVVMHVLERSGPAEFAFTTVNTGKGLEYHESCATDSAATPPKMKYNTCMRMEHLAQERVVQPAYWALFFSLWVKRPASEYHRVEVIYDVLLPWLASAPSGPGTLFQSAVLPRDRDPAAVWATPDRSNTSSSRTALAATASASAARAFLRRNSSSCK